MATKKKTKSSKSSSKRGNVKKAVKKGSRSMKKRSTKRSSDTFVREPAPTPIGADSASNIPQTGQTPMSGNAPALPAAQSRTTQG